MIALGGPKLKQRSAEDRAAHPAVSMIALGGPKLKQPQPRGNRHCEAVSMIALGGPKLKPHTAHLVGLRATGFNDSTGWA